MTHFDIYFLYICIGMKQYKTHQLLDLLTDNEQLSIKQLAERIGKDSRTIYRYLKELQIEGYVIDYNSGYPKLIKLNPDSTNDVYVHFSQTEAMLLEQTFRKMNNGHPIQQSLYNKLASLFAYVGMEHLLGGELDQRIVSCINEGRTKRRVVVLENYASSNSGKVSNRRIEPIKWTMGNRQLQAFDLDKQEIRTFVLSRMGGAKLSEEEWQHKKLPTVMETDCFWMSGNEDISVTLQMSLMALNLLHEEYPLSRDYEVRHTSDLDMPYLVDVKVRSLKGVGRFVLGLPGKVRATGCEALTKYLEEQRKLY